MLGFLSLYIVVELDQKLIFGDDSAFWVRVVEDGRLIDNVTKRRVFNQHAQLAHLRLLLLVLVFEEDLKARSLDVVRHVDDFFEARDAQCHVLCRDSCEVESVQSHLRGRLSHALGGQAANHLTRVDD